MKFIKRIKEDWQKVKDMPTKEKWEFFWDYYKIQAICIILIVVLIVQGVVTVANQKEIVFSGFCINCKIGVDEKPFWNGFYETAGIDEETQTVACYSDVQIMPGQTQLNNNTVQRIIASCAVQDVDFIAGDPYAFQVCAYTSQHLLTDLREVLDGETLEKLAGRIYYIDEAIIDVLNAPAGEQVEPDALEYPKDPKDPGPMKKPVPVGIDVSRRKDLQKAYYLDGTIIYVGAVRSTARPELTRQFMEYLLG
ncbi:MAG: hypothetical protein IKY18_05920 [Oscillospiraceae bacterium]|nr:hypothetical protein [Oscillospiraceae bacterium]